MRDEYDFSKAKRGALLVRPSKPRPELIDADAPSADAEWFARARPAAEVLPGLIGEEAERELLKPKRDKSVRAAKGTANKTR